MLKMSASNIFIFLAILQTTHSQLSENPNLFGHQNEQNPEDNSKDPIVGMGLGLPMLRAATAIPRAKIGAATSLAQVYAVALKARADAQHRMIDSKLRHDLGLPKPLIPGLNGLHPGLPSLNHGLPGLNHGLSGLTRGSTGLGNGFPGLNRGFTGLNHGLTGFNHGLSGLNHGITSLTGSPYGLSGFHTGLSSLKPRFKLPGSSILGSTQNGDDNNNERNIDDEFSETPKSNEDSQISTHDEWSTNPISSFRDSSPTQFGSRNEHSSFGDTLPQFGTRNDFSSYGEGFNNHDLNQDGMTRNLQTLLSGEGIFNKNISSFGDSFPQLRQQNGFSSPQFASRNDFTSLPQFRLRDDFSSYGEGYNNQDLNQDTMNRNLQALLNGQGIFSRNMDPGNVLDYNPFVEGGQDFTPEDLIAVDALRNQGILNGGFENHAIFRRDVKYASNEDVLKNYDKILSGQEQDKSKNRQKVDNNENRQEYNKNENGQVDTTFSLTTIKEKRGTVNANDNNHIAESKSTKSLIINWDIPELTVMDAHNNLNHKIFNSNEEMKNGVINKANLESMDMENHTSESNKHVSSGIHWSIPESTVMDVDNDLKDKILNSQKEIKREVTAKSVDEEEYNSNDISPNLKKGKEHLKNGNTKNLIKMFKNPLLALANLHNISILNLTLPLLNSPKSSKFKLNSNPNLQNSSNETVKLDSNPKLQNGSNEIVELYSNLKLQNISEEQVNLNNNSEFTQTENNDARKYSKSIDDENHSAFQSNENLSDIEDETIIENSTNKTNLSREKLHLWENVYNNTSQHLNEDLSKNETLDDILISSQNISKIKTQDLLKMELNKGLNDSHKVLKIEPLEESNWNKNINNTAKPLAIEAIKDEHVENVLNILEQNEELLKKHSKKIKDVLTKLEQNIEMLKGDSKNIDNSEMNEDMLKEDFIKEMKHSVEMLNNDYTNSEESNQLENIEEISNKTIKDASEYIKETLEENKSIENANILNDDELINIEKPQESINSTETKHNNSNEELINSDGIFNEDEFDKLGEMEEMLKEELMEKSKEFETVLKGTAIETNSNEGLRKNEHILTNATQQIKELINEVKKKSTELNKNTKENLRKNEEALVQDSNSELIQTEEDFMESIEKQNKAVLNSEMINKGLSKESYNESDDNNPTEDSDRIHFGFNSESKEEENIDIEQNVNEENLMNKSNSSVITTEEKKKRKDISTNLSNIDKQKNSTYVEPTGESEKGKHMINQGLNEKPSEEAMLGSSYNDALKEVLLLNLNPIYNENSSATKNKQLKPIDTLKENSNEEELLDLGETQHKHKITKRHEDMHNMKRDEELFVWSLNNFNGGGCFMRQADTDNEKNPNMPYMREIDNQGSNSRVIEHNDLNSKMETVHHYEQHNPNTKFVEEQKPILQEHNPSIQFVENKNSKLQFMQQNESHNPDMQFAYEEKNEDRDSNLQVMKHETQNYKHPNLNSLLVNKGENQNINPCDLFEVKGDKNFWKNYKVYYSTLKHPEEISDIPTFERDTIADVSTFQHKIEKDGQPNRPRQHTEPRHFNLFGKPKKPLLHIFSKHEKHFGKDNFQTHSNFEHSFSNFDSGHGINGNFQKDWGLNKNGNGFHKGMHFHSNGNQQISNPTIPNVVINNNQFTQHFPNPQNKQHFINQDDNRQFLNHHQNNQQFNLHQNSQQFNHHQSNPQFRDQQVFHAQNPQPIPSHMSITNNQNSLLNPNGNVKILQAGGSIAQSEATSTNVQQFLRSSDNQKDHFTASPAFVESQKQVKVQKQGFLGVPADAYPNLPIQHISRKDQVKNIPSQQPSDVDQAKNIEIQQTSDESQVKIIPNQQNMFTHSKPHFLYQSTNQDKQLQNKPRSNNHQVFELPSNSQGNQPTHAITNNQHFLSQNQHLELFNKKQNVEDEIVNSPYLLHFPFQRVEFHKRRNQHFRRKRSLPLVRLMADPNTKLDMPKTLENVGTIAKKSFEDKRAPMYHVKNMIGASKDAFLSSLKIAPQNIIIPSRYKIVDTKEEIVMKPAELQRIKNEVRDAARSEFETVGSNNPNEQIFKGAKKFPTLKEFFEKLRLKNDILPKIKTNDNLFRKNIFTPSKDDSDLFSPRFAFLKPNVKEEVVGDPNVLDTFQKVGSVIRDSIKSSQETISHMNNVAHSARKAYTTSKFSLPRILLPYSNAPVVRSTLFDNDHLMMISPRFLDVTEEDVNKPDFPNEYVKMGEIMDAFGVSKPGDNKVGLSRIIIQKKKEIPILQSRFGGEEVAPVGREFYVISESVDDPKNTESIVVEAFKNLKDIKEMIGVRTIKDFLEEMKREFVTLRKSNARIQSRTSDNDNAIDDEEVELREFLKDLFQNSSMDEIDSSSKIFVNSRSNGDDGIDSASKMSVNSRSDDNDELLESYFKSRSNLNNENSNLKLENSDISILTDKINRPEFKLGNSDSNALKRDSENSEFNIPKSIFDHPELKSSNFDFSAPRSAFENSDSNIQRNPFKSENSDFKTKKRAFENTNLNVLKDALAPSNFKPKDADITTTKRNANIKKNEDSNFKNSLNEEIVGSGMNLPTNLFQPFMNQPTKTELEDYFHEQNDDLADITFPKNPDSLQEFLKLTGLVSSINPDIYMRLFNESLSVEDYKNIDPAKVFKVVDDTTLKSANNREVEEEDQRISMDIHESLLKPYMGKIKVKKGGLNYEDYGQPYQGYLQDFGEDDQDEEAII